MLLNLHWNEQHHKLNSTYLSVDFLSYAVAFLQFSQLAYSQDENNSPLSVSLVLDPFGDSGSGSATISQGIVGQIIAFAQAGNTATGKEIMGYNFINSDSCVLYVM